MKLFHHPDDFKAFTDDLHARDKQIGFVPTMGALHDGHISLIETAQQSCDEVIVSVFVNPTQFNNPDDLAAYPRKPKKDISILKQAKVQAIFMPSVNDMYPKDELLQQIDFGNLETVMEGAHRPGHFQGVAQIILKLLALTGKVQLFMGQKDYQQVCIVRKLLAIENLDTTLVECPTLRDNNGLALSSRNERLSIDGINKARNIYKVLKWIEQQTNQKNWKSIKKEAKEMLKEQKVDVEYLELALTESLDICDKWPQPYTDVVVCFAGYVENVRLIDNLIFKISPD